MRFYSVCHSKAGKSSKVQIQIQIWSNLQIQIQIHPSEHFQVKSKLDLEKWLNPDLDLPAFGVTAKGIPSKVISERCLQ